eukprot:scaffold4176_cov109-Skeletonema_dohrnii-CCMP3373.AAC.7
MMHPISGTDDLIHNEGYAPKSNNIEMQSLFQRDDDDNDDCSINNNHDDELGGAPALASTSSGSSCSDFNDNTHNKSGGGSLSLNSPYPPQHRIDYSHNYSHTNGAPPLHKGPSSSNSSSNNPPSSILSVTTNNNIGHAITPLHNIQYVHGGYAAAAPLFVTHSKFASVLKRLLPGAYVELKGLLHRGDDTAGSNGNTNNNNGGNINSGPDLLREYSLKNDLIDDSSTNPSIHRHSTSSTTSTNHHANLNHTPNNNNNLNSNNNNICITDPVKIMKWAENNPIVSAFGIWNSDNGRRTKRFMQGVVVVKHQSQSSHQQEGEQQEGEGLVNQVDGEKDGSPLRRRLKERIDRSRSPKRNHTKVNGDTTTTTSSNQNKKDVIDEQHLTSLLQSLSTNYSSASNEDDQFDLSFRDRGNSSVVEAVTNDGTTGSGGGVGSSTQQRLLRNYQQHHQQQRKREMSGNSAAAASSSMLPPLPPQITNSTRYSPIRSATPPPPPGSTLLKGGGMSGPGGVSSPRRKVPLPSDLPNSTAATEGANSEHGNGIKRSRSRSLSLTNTSYDAYLNEHRQHSNHHPYNRQRTSSSSSTNFLDPTTDLLHQEPPKQHYNKPAIEWDIFLDPQLVRLVDAALTVVDELETKLHRIRLKRERIRQQRRKEREEKRYQRKKREEMMKRMRMNGGGFGSLAKSAIAEDDSDTATSEDEDDDEDFDLLQAHTAAQVEVDRLVAQLMRRTIIAHGSMSQLVLEGLGWAPEYNFGRVVKNSREGTNLPSPQRRNGHRHNKFSSSGGGGRSQKKDYLSTSLSFSETLSWDEDEEQRDFEALLDRRIHSSSVGGSTGGGAANTGKGGSSSSGTHNSKGMFMEKWLSLFAKSLSLLVRSTNSSSSGGDTDGEDGNNDIVKMSSSSSSASLKKKKKNANVQLIKKKKKKSVAKKPEEQGFTCYLSSLFFGPGKSSNTVDEDDDSDNDKENDNNDDDDDNSAHLTNNDMFSPATTTPKGGILDAFGCGMSLCLGMDDDEGRFNCGTSTGQTSNSVFPLNPHASHQMARDIQRIHDVLGEPLRLVLDLKSRRVPPRVWSRLIDNLRSRGLLIEGIGSFDMDELRVIGKGCSYPLTPMLFFHSVGDLQRACHANEVKKGDTVYFNGGSLMWKRSSIMEAAECGGCCGQIKDVDDESDITHSNNSYGRTPSTATAATT